MANSNKGAGIVVAVVVTLIVAGVGGYMLGNRAGLNAGKMETSAVATVNGEPITKNELYEAMVAEMGTNALDNLIQEKLVEQEAKKANINVTAADVDAEINRLKTKMGAEQFEQALQANNITLEQLRDYQVFRLQLTGLLGKDIPVDETALQKYFETNLAQWDKRQVKARHILVNTEAEAKAIKAQLDAGADFAALAKEKSTEPAAKESGGDLGTFGRGQMVPEFDKVVFTMQKGTTSAPFQTSFGWHVVQVQDITGTAPDYNAVKAEVKQTYIDEQVASKAQAYLTELRDKAKIENTLQKKS